ncbi:hypothetical protein CEXT_288391 [Caerostris extrusa]|uniref:Uncharacterized protein n=1 Tax=Caerostris extrusa TaxID=172846 RepID=A0AAV4MP79_CAEEX|nr:hypothetical protein CEXT_288391 [Caerostris extrusa]
MKPPFRGSALTPGLQCNSESTHPTFGTYGFKQLINPKTSRHAASPGGEGFPFGRTAALFSGEATLVSVPMATGSHVLPAIRRAGFSADAAKIRGSQCRDRDFDQTFGERRKEGQNR